MSVVLASPESGQDVCLQGKPPPGGVCSGKDIALFLCRRDGCGGVVKGEVVPRRKLRSQLAGGLKQLLCLLSHAGFGSDWLGRDGGTVTPSPR